MPEGANEVRRNKTEADITAEALARFSTTPDPRLRQIMMGLINHLHAFVKEVQLTEAEWFQAIEILTEAGKMCSDKRQEFILFSDTLGVSMVVDLIDHRKVEGATESTVFGPFHRLGAPNMPAGGNIARRDKTGVATLVSGRVLDLEGRPIAGAVLDVWQAQTNGLYDSQDKNPDELHMRGKFRTDAEGRYLIRTVQPVNYPIPSDGPVGRMLKATGLHPWRPAHIHFVVSAEGYEPVTTHIFDRTDPYLASDAVFAVKDSLICDFVRHETPEPQADQLGVAPPFYTAAFDFHLQPAAAAAQVAGIDAGQRLAALGARAMDAEPVDVIPAEVKQDREASIADPSDLSWTDRWGLEQPTGRDRREAERVTAYWQQKLAELGDDLTVATLNFGGTETRDWSNRFLIAVDPMIERSSLVQYGPRFARLLNLPEQARHDLPMLRQLPRRYAEVFLRGCSTAQREGVPVHLEGEVERYDGMVEQYRAVFIAVGVKRGSLTCFAFGAFNSRIVEPGAAHGNSPTA
jgi:protocatechuate 3,4-dioxygenase beta subunit